MLTSLVDFLATTETPTTQEPKETEDFPLYVIIVIGAGGALILLIFIVLICCAARYYYRSSKSMALIFYSITLDLMCK